VDPEQDTNPETQDVEQPVTDYYDFADAPQAISALDALRNSQKDSASSDNPDATGGEPAPTSGQGSVTPTPDGREQFIPRNRFDEVNTQKNALEQQLQYMQSQLQQMQMSQQFGQATQPQFSPGGQQLPQPQSQVDPFTDPQIKERLMNKLNEDPLAGLQEIFGYLLNTQGAQALNQFRDEVYGRITPLQQSYASQAKSVYESSRRSDPAFQQIKPTFDVIVQRALSERPDLVLDQATLSTLEHIARINAQQMGAIPYQPPGYSAPVQPQQPPFSEAPMGTVPAPAQQQTRYQVTPEIKAIAERFNVDPQEYARRMAGGR